jgi:hypothetical protein
VEEELGLIATLVALRVAYGAMGLPRISRANPNLPLAASLSFLLVLVLMIEFRERADEKEEVAKDS